MNAVRIMKNAQEGKYAVGQFNVSTDEQITAIIEAAKNLNSPVIIGTSEGERDFIRVEQVVALVDTWIAKTGLPIILNADHCKSFDSVKEVVDAGYLGVHFDGSGLPFEENIKITRRIVEYAKNINSSILVEGELGCLPGSSDIHRDIEIRLSDLTQPEEVKDFVRKTGIDSLAVAIGNIHGMKAEGSDPHLHLDRLRQIQQIAPNVLLVLHGGSGTPVKDLEEAIKLGVVKININTEIRLAYRTALQKFLEENLSEVKSYKILSPAMEAVQKVVEAKIKLFGSENKA